MKRLLFATLAGLFFHNVPHAQGSGLIGANSFAEAVSFPAGIYPQRPVLHDLNGDGRTDLLVANTGGAAVSILRNTGTTGQLLAGSFAAKIDIATGNGPCSVAVHDLDGDGKPDVVVANSTSATVSVLRYIGTGGALDASSFAAKVDLPGAAGSYYVAIGDLDGDGKPDLAVANRIAPTVSVFRNTSPQGTIAFAPRVDFPTGEAPDSVAIGDLDGDGKPDLAVVNEGSNTLSILRNASIPGRIDAASFPAKVDFATAPAPFDVAIGDLDRDGKPDVVVGYNHSSFVSIYRNTSVAGGIGATSLALPVDLSVQGNSGSVKLGDLNGDGKLDIIVGDMYSRISLFQNVSAVGSLGATSFNVRLDFTTASPIGVAFGDVDGDGRPDLAAANYLQNGSVSVLRNASLLFGDMDMVWIAPGTFTMGSPANEQGREPREGPQSFVTLTKGLWLGKYEVTQEQYQRLTGGNPSAATGDARKPVERVSWSDATNYCATLTEQERLAGRLPAGFEYRLPTEAEWEYACRAGTTTRFSYGDDPDYSGLSAYANLGSTEPVGSKKPNPWGLYDMHGNVWEWCLDWYGAYPGGSVTDPKGPSSSTTRGFRGGGAGALREYCRSAFRNVDVPGNTSYDLGFRVALAPRVFPSVPTITWPQPADITYGTPLGNTQLNAGASAAGTFAYSPAAGSILNAGLNQTLTVVFTPADPAQFTAATNTVMLNVTRAPLTVTPANQSRPYGDPNPALTGAVLGVVNNDGISATYTCAATLASVLGDYDITAVLVDPKTRLTNYAVTVNKGRLTVAKAPLSVVAQDAVRDFGDPNPTFTGTITGIKNNDNLSAIFTCAATPASAPGLYDIIPSLVDPSSRAANYAVSLLGGRLTVKPLEPPQIVVQPQTQAVQVGTDLILSVSVVGKGLQFQWKKDGVALPAATSATLTVRTIGWADAGRYTVVVANAGGTIESQAAAVQVTAAAAHLSDAMYLGITLTGTVGGTYRIEYVDALTDPNNWKPLATITLSSPSQLWFDLDSPNQRHRVYRAVTVP